MPFEEILETLEIALQIGILVRYDDGLRCRL